MLPRRVIDFSLLLIKSIIVFFLAVGSLAFIFPGNSTSFTQAYLEWAKKLAIGIPIAFALEFTGTKLLGLPFVARLSSPARIAVVTTTTVLTILLFILGIDFVKHD
ncbi:MAG: hypothetical protein AB1400_04470 [Pseudomonadota bacterium]